MRTLAADLGAAVGSAAHLVSLRRTRVGGCAAGEAWPVEELVAAARAGVAAEAAAAAAVAVEETEGEGGEP